MKKAAIQFKFTEAGRKLFNNIFLAAEIRLFNSYSFKGGEYV